jgi:uncharacterized membrane protein
MWIFGIFIGSLFLTWLWYVERTNAMSFYIWWSRIVPITIVSELAYWYAFRSCPHWIAARYIMSAMTNILGLSMAFILLKEGINIKQAVGIAFIITGGFLLK